MWCSLFFLPFQWSRAHWISYTINREYYKGYVEKFIKTDHSWDGTSRGSPRHTCSLSVIFSPILWKKSDDCSHLASLFPRPGPGHHFNTIGNKNHRRHCRTLKHCWEKCIDKGETLYFGINFGYFLYKPRFSCMYCKSGKNIAVRKLRYVKYKKSIARCLLCNTR